MSKEVYIKQWPVKYPEIAEAISRNYALFSHEFQIVSTKSRQTSAKCAPHVLAEVSVLPLERGSLARYKIATRFYAYSFPAPDLMRLTIYADSKHMHAHSADAAFTHTQSKCTV
jgi:hypothetical protein